MFTAIDAFGRGDGVPAAREVFVLEESCEAIEGVADVLDGPFGARADRVVVGEVSQGREERRARGVFVDLCACLLDDTLHDDAGRYASGGKPEAHLGDVLVDLRGDLFEASGVVVVVASGGEREAFVELGEPDLRSGAGVDGGLLREEAGGLDGGDEFVPEEHGVEFVDVVVDAVACDPLVDTREAYAEFAESSGVRLWREVFEPVVETEVAALRGPDGVLAHEPFDVLVEEGEEVGITLGRGGAGEQEEQERDEAIHAGWYGELSRAARGV